MDPAPAGGDWQEKKIGYMMNDAGVYGIIEFF